ncbi:helix-turn-helix domain-containing protein [Myroides injenensis]|uniref:helix-turn-helix domain-containing protein n=1 Tax=Myroides injenensis TaxID=1183151 RepID=UPI00226FA2FD|nr:helix-turn-helix domain-containing protein [Myroides injenensis]
MRGILLYLFFIVSSVQITYGQQDLYEKTYNEIQQDLLHADIKRAIYQSDYLLSICKTNQQRIKTYFLKTQLLRQNGIRGEAIVNLEKADSIAYLEKDYIFLSRINGILSTLYRENGLSGLGKIALEKGISYSEQLPLSDDKFRFLGNTKQELAYYQMQEQNYLKAISYLQEGFGFYKLIKGDIDKKFLFAINNELIAKNYLLLQQIDSAYIYLKKAELDLSLSNSSSSALKGFIYDGLGVCFLEKQDYKSALDYFNNAWDIAEQSGFFELKLQVGRSLLEYYKKTENSKEYSVFAQEYLQLKEQEENKRNIISNSLVDSMYEKEVLIKKQHKKQMYYAQWGLMILSFSLLTLFFCKGINLSSISIFTFKSKNRTNALLICKEDNYQKFSQQDDKEYMSKDMEDYILERIEGFEKQRGFLDKDISLSVLAGQFGCNHRYLSHVINKYKQKEFTSYINELRIKYIVECLYDNSDYLLYKISYLAQQSGFASHSRFTITFKKVVGESPSQFINRLKKENK